MKNRSCHSYIFLLLVNVILISCCYAFEEEDAFADVTGSQNFINPHSFHYDRVNKKMLTKDQLNEKTLHNEEPIPSTIKIEPSIHRMNSNTQERIFYMRLVNLLVSSMSRQVDEENVIMGTVTLKLSGSQLKIINNAQVDNVPLREVDAIMSEIIKKPSFDFIPETLYIASKFADHMEYLWWKMQDNAQIIIAICVTLVLLVFSRRLLRVSIAHGLPICVMIQIIFVTSFFMTWMQLVKEAEIKLTAQQRMYSDIPLACQPDKMNMWHKFVATVFPTNDCEKYYEALMANANLKVTPAHALSHLLSTVLLHPVSVIGTVISEFIDNCTGQLSWMYAWSIKILLFTCIGAVLIILPLCVSGASFQIGLGPLFKLGLDFKQKKSERESIEYSKDRQPVKIIREIHHVHPPAAITGPTESDATKDIASVETYRVPRIKSGKKSGDSQKKSKKVIKQVSHVSDSSGDEYLDSSDTDDIIVNKTRGKSRSTEIGAGDTLSNSST